MPPPNLARSTIARLQSRSTIARLQSRKFPSKLHKYHYLFLIFIYDFSSHFYYVLSGDSQKLSVHSRSIFVLSAVRIVNPIDIQQRVDSRTLKLVHMNSGISRVQETRAHELFDRHRLENYSRHPRPHPSSDLSNKHTQLSSSICRRHSRFMMVQTHPRVPTPEARSLIVDKRLHFNQAANPKSSPFQPNLLELLFYLYLFFILSNAIYHIEFLSLYNGQHSI